MPLREATMDDLGALLVLCERMHAETMHAHIPFADDKVAWWVRNAIERPDWFAMVAEQDGELVGGLLAYADEMYFSHARYCCDIGFYIAPEYRGGLSAPRLLRAYLEWAKQQGLESIQIGIGTGITVEQTSKFYEAFGFKRTHAIFEWRG